MDAKEGIVSWLFSDSTVLLGEIRVCGRLSGKCNGPSSRPMNPGNGGIPLPALILGCMSCGFSDRSFAVAQHDIGPRSHLRHGCRLPRAQLSGEMWNLRRRRLSAGSVSSANGYFRTRLRHPSYSKAAGYSRRSGHLEGLAREASVGLRDQRGFRRLS